MDWSWLTDMLPDISSSLDASSGLSPDELSSLSGNLYGFDASGAGMSGGFDLGSAGWGSGDPQYQAALKSLGYDPGTGTYTDPSGFSYQGTAAPATGNPGGFGGMGSMASPAAAGILKALGLGGAGGGGLGDASLLSGLLSGAGGLGSALIGSNAATNAANTQYQSAQQAMGLQKGMFDRISSAMTPYNQAGQDALGGLNNFGAIGSSAAGGLSSMLGLGTSNPLSSPLMQNVYPGLSAAPNVAPTLASGAPSVNQTVFGPTSAAPNVNQTIFGAPRLDPTVNGLPKQITDMFQHPEDLPGYSFTLDQGKQAVQNANSAQGLGLSGASMKGLTKYAEDLASTYIPTYANLALGQQSSNLNYLGAGFDQRLQGANMGLSYGSAAFGQQQQQFTNWLQDQNLHAQFGQLGFDQQNQIYQNWLNQQTGLFGQQQQGFKNWYDSGNLGITQGNSLLAQNQQRYGMLSDTSKQGQGALTNVGSFGAGSMNALGAFGGTMGGSLAGLLTGGGAALAGGQVGSANALTGGLTSALNGLGQGLLSPYVIGSMGRNAFGAGYGGGDGMYGQVQ